MFFSWTGQVSAYLSLIVVLVAAVVLFENIQSVGGLSQLLTDVNALDVMDIEWASLLSPLAMRTQLI